MGPNKGKNRISEDGGFDYESAYSAAENVKLDPKDARTSRAAVIEEQLEENESPRQTRERLRKEHDTAKIKKRIIIAAVTVLGAVVIALAAVLIMSHLTKLRKAAEEEESRLDVSDRKAVVEELYTYGTHLNMTGTLPEGALKGRKDAEVSLVLYGSNGELTDYSLLISGNEFTLSEYCNAGLYLDGLERDTYLMFIRVATEQSFEETTAEETEEDTDQDTDPGESTGGEDSSGLEKKKPEEAIEEETEETLTEESKAEQAEVALEYRYYALENNTGHQETVYFTMSSAGNRIVIENESEYQTIQMTVSADSGDGVYDVVIDAGHGGSDQGAAGIDGHHEKDYLLPLAEKIKENLEKNGMKVALTRDNDEETLGAYGEDGRVARACRSQAKYMISLHMNDEGAGMSGLMIYAYPDNDMAFARLMNAGIQEHTGIGNASAASPYGDNIFSKMLSQADIDQEKADNAAAGLIPYEPSLRSAYHFMIRECGGIVTGAYKDDRNPEEKYNPYCYDNTGVETYIIELGYITNENDVRIMTSKMDEYARAISDSLFAVYGAEVKDSED